MGVGGTSSKLKRAARKMVAACGSFSPRKPPALADPVSIDTSVNISGYTTMSPTNSTNISEGRFNEEAESTNIINSDNSIACKSLCAICLDALSYGTGSSPGEAIFTAQCSHAFHLACISSNVRHGSVTCPICRAHWTQLPRNLNPPCSFSCNQTDPVFQILDDSIATFRVHRRSFLHSAHYDDDEPIDPDHISNQTRLDFSLVPAPPALFLPACGQHPSLEANGRRSYYHHQLRQHHYVTGSSSLFTHPTASYTCPSLNRRVAAAAAAHLSVKLTHQQATDLVLVAYPNGPHLRLLKQSMALVVFSLRPVDRLSIVTYSSAAARVFPLRRMTSYGKRTALQVIDRLFFMGQAEPIEGLKKGIKVLEDRVHKNLRSCILHLSDSPTRSYHSISMQISVPIHRFHVGFGFGNSNGFVMHEFEEFLARLLKGVIRDVQLRIGEEGRTIMLGELRGNEERRILLELGEYEHVCVSYSYAEGGVEECTRTGETLVSLGNKREAHDPGREAAAAETETDLTTAEIRNSNVESWDYHDPYMARRWAKHLHGYRL